ncbi:MAG: hypothetical protein ACPL1K_03835 [Candidatus Kryptoniota bacterium]
MKNNYKLGAWFSVVGVVIGILFFYLIAKQYNLVIDAHAAIGRTDEATSVSITFAVLGWFGISATAIWVAVLYGFLQSERWAWFWGAVAATIQLLTGFFPAIPAMDSHLSMPTLSVFGVALILWFGMLLIGDVDKKIIGLTFVAGLAYVLTFIDGVAPISKYTTSHNNPFWNGMYVMTQEVSWWGSAAWAIFIFAVFKKKTWSIPVGLFAASMSMLAGYPLGLHNAIIEVHRFSMFLPAPLISSGLFIYLLLLGTRKMLQEWNKKPE